MGVRALSRLFLLGLLWKTTEGCLGGQPLGFYPPAYGSSYGAAPYGPYAASRTRMASPSHTLVANSVDGDGLQQLSDCSQRFENQKLTCQQLCDQYATRCRGFQFDSLAGMCEVFDVDRMTAQRGPYAQDDQMEKDDQFDSTYKQRHRRYTSKNPFDEYLRDPLRMFSSSDSPGQYCEPSLLSALGVTYVQTDPGCRTALNPTAASSYVGAVEPLPSVDRLPPTNKLAAGVGPVQLSPPPATQTLIDGIEVNRETKPLLGVQLDSPDACLHICQLNAHLDGTPFSRPCRAAAFDRSTGRCKIYEQAISPNGQLNYTPAKNSIYFEKFCIPGSEIPSGCEDVINRMPQHALDRRASGTGAIVTASTQINCIRQCLAASATLGFDCASASYFFDWPSENCYLSRFTRISRPDIYVSEKKELVDYIEMPKCLQQNGARSNWQRDAAPSSWSEWTKCDERTFTRSRHRNCSECRNRIETMPCISEAAYQHEFSNALMDTGDCFESARRYKEAKKPPVDSAEASLFGEQDYDNQREVSFFGPPIVAKGTPNKKAEVPLDVELR
ncbi:hypothetical protein M3Y99_01862100 [Aphelenchoides fujianensis]|nr:hypothetical protein M3Y99_01862100 [Aphelenchoides fujianensis]